MEKECDVLLVIIDAEISHLQTIRKVLADSEKQRAKPQWTPEAREKASAKMKARWEKAGRG